MSRTPQSLDQLGNLSRGRSRHRPRDAAHLYGGPYPFIQTGDVKHAGLYISEYQQTYSDAGLQQSRLWPAGTLCITIAANIADTAILGMDACFPDSVIGFIADEKKADTRFVKYLFDATIQRHVKQFAQGAAQDNLSQEKLLSIEFPVPDVTEQKRIADVLSTYDDLIENNRRRIQLLEQAARLLYKEWFVHLRFPGHEHVNIKYGVPEGWNKTTIGNVSSFISRGITPNYDDEAPGIVINQKCIRDQRVTMDVARRQSKEVTPNKLVRYGDVLINSTGQGTLGRVAQFLEDIENCTVDSHIMIARPNEDMPVFLYGRQISSMEDYLASMGRGATNQTELSKDIVAELPYLQPPHILADQFESFAKDTADQVRNLTQQNTMLTKARDLLLPRMMSGEVAV
jgi:type I restriction enzyme S subunit